MIGSPARDTLDRREQRVREIGRELLPERAIERHADLVENLSTFAGYGERAVVDFGISVNDEVRRMRERDRRGGSD